MLGLYFDPSQSFYLRKTGGKETMKVLFYESRPEWGGAQKCELEIMQGLKHFQIEPLFVTSTTGPLLERALSEGIEVHQIAIHPKIDSIRKDDIEGGLISKLLLSLYMLPHFLKLMKFVIKSEAEIIYTSQLRSQFMVGWIGKLLKRKVVWHIHGEENLSHPIGKLAVYTADQIIVVSEKLCNHYSSMFPKKYRQFSYIANGVNVGTKKSLTDSVVTQLITVGALIKGKRQDLCIQACSYLINRGYKLHLHIVGEKPHWHQDQYRSELYELVKTHQLQSHVTFHGWVEEPYSLLAQSDIFLLPSDTEGLPLSIIEAMGVGIPSIATNVGGVSELIVDQETGLLIEKDSVESLATAITKLIQDKSLRHKMGQAALHLYEKKYTSKAFLEGVVGVLRTVQK
jgi:L-malate glycosyltransferase